MATAAGATILGIETSCDETSAAVVRAGRQVLSNVVSSQFATHRPFEGVVPELASREHLRAIVPVVRQALSEAGLRYEDVDALAVTQGPGLAGALLVGISYAKALAFALEKPLIAVNHLEGHIHAVLLELQQEDAGEVQFPVLALVVSGGHTHLYLCTPLEGSAKATSMDAAGAAAWSYRNIGSTRDDAAGEAFDKVAKLLGLGYPGGPVIDALAPHGDPRAVPFAAAQIKGRPRTVSKRASREVGTQERPRFDFSFSGIKTAALRYVEAHGMAPSIAARRAALAGMKQPRAEDYLELCDRPTLDLIASFQRAVVEDLAAKTLAAAAEYGAATLFVTGGVAANRELRARFQERGAQAGLRVAFPSRPLSTDNAAMIAAAAYPRFLSEEFAAAEVSAEASLRLG